MLTRFVLAAFTVTFAIVFLSRIESPPVRVAIPLGLTAGFSSTTRATNGTVYVTIDTVSVRNPSGVAVQFYEASDFRLLVDEREYPPVVRPGLRALDFSGSGSVRPNEPLRVTLTFEVPSGTSNAELEFLPHWFDDNGGRVAFCCYYP